MVERLKITAAIRCVRSALQGSAETRRWGQFAGPTRGSERGSGLANDSPVTAYRISMRLNESTDTDTARPAVVPDAAGNTHPDAGPVKLPSYRPPFWLRNGHANTIIGGRFRKVTAPSYRRERIDTPDGDFIDIDWASGHGLGAGKDVAIVSHGLEGSSDRPYIRGMVRALTRAGWDVAAWNFRGCSGELNRLLRSYHSGATEDLDTVIDHVADRGYARIALVGFSLGGNLTLKYLGERGNNLPVEAAVVISVPCDLIHGMRQLDRKENRIYAYRFLRSLRDKYVRKARRFPDDLDIEAVERIRTLRDFDDIYTAPVHGFRNAFDYWRRCSSLRFIPAIRRPTLILNAADDSFLAGNCYPLDAVAGNPSVHMRVPDYGGHIGFIDSAADGTARDTSYAELCTLTWLTSSSE